MTPSPPPISSVPAAPARAAALTTFYQILSLMGRPQPQVEHDLLEMLIQTFQAYSADQDAKLKVLEAELTRLRSKPMTKIQAIETIVRDSQRQTSTRTSYKRIKVALRALGFSPEDQIEAEKHLEYWNAEGHLYQFFKESSDAI
jgi:Ca2+-binding EF-hand superfamily protein